MSAVERSSSRGEVEESEAEWMVRSTGEGVEEVWERAVSGSLHELRTGRRLVDQRAERGS